MAGHFPPPAMPTAKFKHRAPDKKKKQAGTGSNSLFIVQQSPAEEGQRRSQAANIDKQPDQDVVTKSKKQVDAIRSQHFNRCSGINLVGLSITNVFLNWCLG